MSPNKVNLLNNLTRLIREGCQAAPHAPDRDRIRIRLRSQRKADRLARSLGLHPVFNRG